MTTVCTFCNSEYGHAIWCRHNEKKEPPPATDLAQQIGSLSGALQTTLNTLFKVDSGHPDDVVKEGEVHRVLDEGKKVLDDWTKYVESGWKQPKGENDG